MQVFLGLHFSVYALYSLLDKADLLTLSIGFFPSQEGRRFLALLMT